MPEGFNRVPVQEAKRGEVVTLRLKVTGETVMRGTRVYMLTRIGKDGLPWNSNETIYVPKGELPREE